MRRTTLVVLAISLCSTGLASGQESAAIALEQSLRRVRQDVELWPGYDPLSVPLAVFDGTRTYLFRHRSPPDEFVPSGDWWVFEGRHPSVTANSSARLGGLETATIMLETLPGENRPEDLAALVAHEAFHVFQGTTGRRWGADETALFTYPVDDARLLAMRRLETAALTRALEAGDLASAGEWALGALRLRDERFALMDTVSRSYERGMEAMEGTASYVECRAAGRKKPLLPAGDFTAEDVRSRAYQTGAAWAFLLDRFNPTWRDSFGVDDTLFLDTALAQALRDSSAHCRQAAFAPSEISAAEDAARNDVERLSGDRLRRREEFELLPGWRVVVEAGDPNPLWPQAFDPMNVHAVKGGLLHSRFLRLGNARGSLEMMGLNALTEGVGPHPLFNGVRRLAVRGFQSAPVIADSAGTLRIRSTGFSADFSEVAVVREGEEITIRLGSSTHPGDRR